MIVFNLTLAVDGLIANSCTATVENMWVHGLFARVLYAGLTLAVLSYVHVLDRTAHHVTDSTSRNQLTSVRPRTSSCCCCLTVE